MSGDYGGTIYLTVPMSRVRCTEGQLHALLSDLDAIHWMGGADYNAKVSYHDVPAPGHIAGGDGGGEVIDGVWAHPWIDDEVATLAREVIAGVRERLPGRLLRKRRAERLAQRRQGRESQPPMIIRGQELTWDFDVAEPVEPFPSTED